MNIPLNIDWQQILLHMMNFVILAGGLYLLLYKPVKDFMDKRTQHYKDMDETADNVLAQAKEAKQEYENKLSSVNDEIAQLRAKAQKDAEQYMKEQIEQSRQKSDKIISDARKAAEREHEKMIAQARSEVAQIAVEAVDKLLSADDSVDGFLAAAGKEH